MHRDLHTRVWTSLLSFVLLGVVAGVFGTVARAADHNVVVFAAASLKNALDDIAGEWARETGKHASLSYAASSALARQIESSAPADLFFSADLDWMDYLAERQLVKPETRRSLLGNRLVLIAPHDSTIEASIAPHFKLAALLGDGHLAMADTAAVPAGKYGKAALASLGVWPQLQGKIAQSENVRAALLLVSRGEAPLGIVYRTDALADASVKVLDTFPLDSHPPIVYPVAQLRSSENPDAAVLLAFLKSVRAKAVFEKHGFSVLD